MIANSHNYKCCKSLRQYKYIHKKKSYFLCTKSLKKLNKFLISLTIKNKLKSKINLKSQLNNGSRGKKLCYKIKQL